MDQHSTFLVEFSSGESDYIIRSTTVYLFDNPEGVIIQSIQTGDFTNADNYWTRWGGNYDGVPTDPFFTLFIDQFLTRVDNREDLLNLEYSSLVEGNMVYFHIPFYLWQIEDILSRIEFLSGYSSNVPDYNFPSSDRIDGKRYPVWMKIPSLPLSLSNPVNGVNLSPTFSITLDNTEGQFDLQDSTTLLNNPITVRRSVAHPATKESFQKIRVGEIENVTLDMDKIILQGADALRTLEDPACRTISEAGIGDSGDSLPLAYGSFKGTSLIELSMHETESGEITSYIGRYLVCDPDYCSSVSRIYNRDGDDLYNWSFDSGVITATWIDDPADETERPSQEPATCDFNGKYSGGASRMGLIIKKEVSEKTKLIYTSSFWNIEETESYIAGSPSLNFFFESGSVKQLITEVLKSDMAFFIQQNTGLVTLRRWANNYTQHSVPKWMNTKKPTRKFSDYKYYYSSVVVNYDRGSSVLNSSVESETVAKWKKKSRGTFDTALRNENQALNLSKDLLDRFANRAQMWDVGIGQNTSNIELLDSLYLELKINDRELSKFTKWKIIGINPAQDVLTIEEDSFDPLDPEIDIDEVPISQPSNQNESGYLSHPSNQDESGVLSQMTANK